MRINFYPLPFIAQMKRVLGLIFLNFVFILLLAAQSGIELVEIARGLQNPVDIVHAGDDRLFIVEQRGVIKLIGANGEVFTTPFLDISSRVDFGGERGLLGLAFPPDYGASGFFYVNYTGVSGTTHVARFSRSLNANIANPNSEVILLSINQPFANHNGGCLKFGTDGYLYIGLGDGGSSGDPQNNAQNDNSLLGKILRIDVAHAATYAIPPDNPFVNDPNVRNEIWVTGLRNPWRFSFDRLTSDLWIGDVGQSSFEEIDLLPAGHGGGADFGWRCYEGLAAFNTNGCASENAFVFPVFTYPTTLSVGESITGGFVYRGSENPALYGAYIYGDFVSGRIWALTQDMYGEWASRELLKIGGGQISSFGENKAGELLMTAYGSGQIYKIKQALISDLELIEEIASLKILSNPFEKQLAFTLEVASLLDLNIQIINIAGKVVFEKNQSIQGKVNVALNLADLNSGMYILNLASKDRQMSRKIIKL